MLAIFCEISAKLLLLTNCIAAPWDTLFPGVARQEGTDGETMRTRHKMLRPTVRLHMRGSAEFFIVVLQLEV